MDWSNKTVAVTGAGGFIGSHLVERLLAEGAQVRGLVQGNAGYLAGLEADGLKVVVGDLLDRGCLAGLMDGVDCVFHLGAITSVAYSYAHPVETVEVNVMGTVNVLEAARVAGVGRFVHTSTAGVYGSAEGGKPISESHPVSACNPYTAAKLGADNVVETYFRSYDFPVTTLRLFNTYGPRMGQYLILPTIVEQLMVGSQLRLGDLRPTRPFAYVDDVVEAYLRMGVTDGVLGEVVHVGAEEDISMLALVERVSSIMEQPYALVEDASRLRPENSEIFRVCVDSSKARRLLGWSPGVGLEAGLRSTVDWIKGGGYGI